MDGLPFRYLVRPQCVTVTVKSNFHKTYIVPRLGKTFSTTNSHWNECGFQKCSKFMKNIDACFILFQQHISPQKSVIKHVILAHIQLC